MAALPSEVPACELQAQGEAPHDMRDAVACERGHAYCIECLGEHALRCERCGGLACCCCPGFGEARCPECTLLGRMPQSLCHPCFEINRFRCCKKAALNTARCDYHHWHASICACGMDLCVTCRRLGRCPCGDFRIVTLGSEVGPAGHPVTVAVKPGGGVCLVNAPLRQPQRKARSPPAHVRSAFQSPRFRPVSAPMGTPAPIEINCL